MQTSKGSQLSVDGHPDLSNQQSSVTLMKLSLGEGYVMVEKRAKRYATYHSYELESKYVEYQAFAETIEGVRNFISKREAPDEKVVQEGNSEVVDGLPEIQSGSEFSEFLTMAFEKLFGYYDLLIFYTAILPNLGQDMYVRNVVEYARKNLVLVEEFEGFPIYEVDETVAYRLNRNYERVGRHNQSESAIRSSILLSLVATYDAVFANLCQLLLKQHPDRYKGSDRHYSVEEILSLTSIEEILEKVIDDEIDQLMSKNHTDQMSFVEKNFNISFKDKFARWSEYVEIFERRNVAAHGDLLVNKRYIENCKRSGLLADVAIGDRLNINTSYMNNSVDTLLEVIILITFAVWRKRAPEKSDDAFTQIVSISFDLLKDGRNSLAIRLTDYALKIKDDGCERLTRNMLVVNNAIGLKEIGDEKACESIVNSVDWSGSSPLFKLAVASLKGDVEEATKHLEAAKIADQLDIVSLREWPVFQWVRSDERFQLAVENVYEEPFAKTGAILTEDGKRAEDKELVDN